MLVLLLLQVAYQGIEEKLPLRVAPQPIAFSHKLHAEKKLQCTDCHTKALAGERATIPQADRCNLCHDNIPQDRRISWVRVYRLPDFVFFSHAAHTAKGGIDCQACHGPVATREVLQKEVSTSMRFCVDCHRGRNAPLDCSRCHELGQ